MNRLALDIIFFLSVFLFPWWLVMVFGVVLAFIFKNYFEIVFAGIIIDMIFGDKGIFLLPFPIFYTLLFLIIVVLVNLVKTRLR
ncbi:hypothetical protein COW81_00835 [Candidatus Campbellbacteria bacterium CG22_combo_CG10-13_8_21_14_all_36_13]|uniref:Uncharacterized protein n=1 Tax=Candidatus Campbellbacteria bacterium CG22_combo_CG10-13_8_21_14_all_36_13 TaxID=1974529 RepID=A0A2H0DZA5_9BACT|nr:MAG: hypothetical protein COW81_00835 [Candidatus Campbellbacteria bacterium CG22_combo_CG10-13_8_21_14_all_36_13]